MRRCGVLLAVSVLIFASCSQEPEEQVTPAEPASLQVKATEYSFSGAPKTTASGAVEVTITDSGKEPHQAQLFKLNDGVEIGQLVDVGKKPEPERDFSKVGTFAGGPNAVDPGETQTAVAELTPGRYAFFCQVPNPEGKSHLSLGMVSTIEVTQADEEAEAPSGDLSSSAKEFSFELPESWDGTVSFQNNGEQPHELQVIGVAEGKTPEDVQKFFSPDAGESSGPPPWTTGGGIAGVEPGGNGTFVADLAPGTYFAMCFFADPQKKAPHFALGMMQKFEVK